MFVKNMYVYKKIGGLKNIATPTSSKNFLLV